MFKNISNFYDLNDYFPIILGSFIIYIVQVFMLYFVYKYENKLKKFNEKFSLASIFTDLILLITSIVRARFFYTAFICNNDLFSFFIFSAVLQLLYDIILGNLYNIIPFDNSLFKDVLKNQNTKVLKFTILIRNMLTNILGIFVAGYLATFNLNSNINILLTMLNVLPYVIYLLK